MKTKLGLAIFLLAVTLSSISVPKSALAAFTAADFCNSSRLKSIVEGVLCKRDNCGDEGKLNDYLFACTQIDPADANRFGADAVRIDLGEDTRAAAFARVNDSYPVLEALNTMRVDPPPKFIELPPCDCLANIEAKTQCKIEKCAPEPPVNIPAATAATSDSTQAKAQVPDQPATGNGGSVALSGGSGLCSLGHGDLPNQSTIWTCLGILNGLALLASRRRASAFIE